MVNGAGLAMATGDMSSWRRDRRLPRRGRRLLPGRSRTRFASALDPGVKPVHQLSGHPLGYRLPRIIGAGKNRLTLPVVLRAEARTSSREDDARGLRLALTMASDMRTRRQAVRSRRQTPQSNIEWHPRHRSTACGAGITARRAPSIRRCRNTHAGVGADARTGRSTHEGSRCVTVPSRPQER